MPIFDLPLDKLHEYQGTNPRPDDFDAYWDSALAEMRALDPDVELVPGGIECRSADCFDLYFTGVGGARIHAKYLRPKPSASRNHAQSGIERVDEPHPGIVVFHGYSGSSGDWATYLSYISEGFSIVALDVRGQGGLSEDVGGVKGNTLRGHVIRGLSDSPEKLLFRSIYLDCAQLAGILMEMPEVDPDRVGCTGISQGGGLSLACAALEPRIKKAAAQVPFLCDFKRVWDLDLAKDAYQELRDFFRMFDPMHERQREIFTTLGYIDCQHLAPRIKGEVLMLTGLMDTVCPPSTQFAAYNKITSPKQVIIYPDFGHEGLPRSTDKVFEFMRGL